MSDAPDFVENWELGASLGKVGWGTWSLAQSARAASFYRDDIRTRALVVFAQRNSNEHDYVGMAFAEAEIARVLPGFPFQSVLEISSGPMLHCALEYIPPTPLRQWLDAGEPWPVGAVVRLGAALCEAVARLHAVVGPDGRPLRMVCRPTPDSIWITPAGELRIASPVLHQWLGGAVTDDATRIRDPWEYDHVSPEVVRGLPCDAASDVYAIALLLLELCAGRALFVREDRLKMIADMMDVRLPLDAFARVPTELHAPSCLARSMSIRQAPQHCISRRAAPRHAPDR